MQQAYRAGLPYPKLDRLHPDRCAAEIIAPAYAGSRGELGTILQYLYHHFRYTEKGMERFSLDMEGIAAVEMTHFDLLGTALIRLGVDPVFTMHPPRRCDCFNTSRIAYSGHPQKMILDDIEGEQNAIARYEDMICRLRNEEVAALIQRIVMDERLHVKILCELLESFDALSEEVRREG